MKTNFNLRMKWMSLALAATFAGGFLAHAAEDHPTPHPEITERIQTLLSDFDSIFNEVQVVIGQKTVQFPEYKEALDRFRESSKNLRTRYALGLEEIKKKAVQTLSNAYTELQTTETLYRQEPTPALKRLLGDHQERVKRLEKQTQEEINAMYATLLTDAYTLGGKLVFPVIEGRHFWNNALVVAARSTYAIPIAGALGLAIFPALGEHHLVGASLIAGFFGALIAVPLNRDLTDEIHSKNFPLDYVVVTNAMVPVHGNMSEEDYYQALLQSSRRVYSDCKTAGCVYQMAENYRLWSSKVRRLNRGKSLTSNLELHPIAEVSQSELEDALDQVTEIAASERPVGVFK